MKDIAVFLRGYFIYFLQLHFICLLLECMLLFVCAYRCIFVDK